MLCQARLLGPRSPGVTCDYSVPSTATSIIGLSHSSSTALAEGTEMVTAPAVGSSFLVEDHLQPAQKSFLRAILKTTSSRAYHVHSLLYWGVCPETGHGKVNSRSQNDSSGYSSVKHLRLRPLFTAQVFKCCTTVCNIARNEDIVQPLLMQEDEDDM
ncbi:hypothetical protein PR048_018804 [Dryococelus australis]|uniref:Uncharacterized protein n=1 Tax=Dryococelus australis TaxID=614101 RepID=A0ABQ9H1U2_9NEOP|nr:hypothetical protein PR048_018804 [Dryococelus australis]